jgi:hypothetical protein
LRHCADYAEHVKADEEREAVRRQNERIACAGGVAAACDAIKKRLK